MAPISSRAAIASGIATRVDSAVDRASSVLEIFKAIHTAERKLRIDDPRHDLRKYLAMVCCMERYLQILQKAYGPSLEWLEDVIGFLNHNRALDKYSLDKLADELAQSKRLDPYRELMKIDGGGLLNVPLQKLEDEFGRLLAENCNAIDLAAHARSFEISDASGTPEPLVSEVGPAVTLMEGDAINKLLVIADRLKVNGRLEECLQLYIESRVRTVRKSLASLKPEYLHFSTVEALNGLKWEDIHGYLFLWLRDLKAIVRVLMVSERELCNQVFHTLDPPSERVRCFAEIVQESKFTLFFRFAEAVSSTQHRPEALLVGLLDLFKGIEGMKEELDRVFDGCRGTLADLMALQRPLVHNVCRAFWQLVKNVDTHQSQVPSDGGKDFNASFVVNYMGMILRDYKNPMEEALRLQQSSKVAGSIVEASLPSAAHSIMDALGKSLENRATKGYDDPILANMFLMNNYRHVLVRLKECAGLAECLGEDFRMEWKRKVDHNMRGYLRKAWEKVMVHLSREGIHFSSGGRGISRDVLRARMKAFNAAFEEAYRQQCRWVILDPQLRESVQMAVTQLLVPTYHSFVQSYGSLLEEAGPPHRKVIRYSGDTLQNMVGNLFQGKQPHPMSAEQSNSY